MATRTQISTQTQTQTQAVAPPAAPVDGNQSTIIWGVFYKPASVDNLGGKSVVDVKKERKEARESKKDPKGKGKAKAAPANDDDDDDGEKQRRPEPRISVAEDMAWSPVRLNNHPYPADVDSRANTRAYKVGPAFSSKPLVCDLERDIFIIDRSILASIERPVGTEQNRDPIDVFAEKSGKRAKDGRKRVYEYILVIRNVAFNINDPASLLIYLDHLIRAQRSEKAAIRDLANAKKTVIFFSTPATCDHEDCAAWRANTRQFRPPGATNIYKMAWWNLADACVRPSATMQFDILPHRCDPQRVKNISFQIAVICRSWHHALLCHGLARPDSSAFRIVTKERYFPMLVDDANPNAGPQNQGGCHTTTRADDMNSLFRVVLAMSAGVPSCCFCGNAHAFQFEYGSIPGFQFPHTYILYLHYSDDDHSGQDGGAKGAKGYKGGKDGGDENKGEGSKDAGGPA
ncbi:hypothetical protein F5Y04DRAFT_291343 [Hypomontagnella monticulosa]|nr:hypothetical protein F5Y04DRAFT_291343 [Hypomontagnella monticulosa]